MNLQTTVTPEISIILISTALGLSGYVSFPVYCTRKSPVCSVLLLARLEPAYSLIWGVHRIWGQGGREPLALL